MARPSKLADPDYAKAVAELYASGMKQQDMADELGVNRDTIQQWVKDPRVTAHTGRLIMERVQRITRKIDTSIEARLQHIDRLSLDELLKVRKEFLERAMLPSDKAKADQAGVIDEVSEAMDSDPDLAEALRKIVSQEA